MSVIAFTNEELDVAVLKEIKREPMFVKLLIMNLQPDYPNIMLYRPIDNALKRLKKANKIKFVAGRWRPT